MFSLVTVNNEYTVVEILIVHNSKPFLECMPYGTVESWKLNRTIRVGFRRMVSTGIISTVTQGL